MYKLFINNNLVEAAGIEPASEARAIQTSTCLFGEFNLVKLPTHRQICNFTNLIKYHRGFKGNIHS